MRSLRHKANKEKLVPLLLLILLLGWLALFGSACELAERTAKGWSKRSSFQLASLVWASLLVLITEGLSLFTSLSQPALIVVWLGVALLAGGLYSYLAWKRTNTRLAEQSLTKLGLCRELLRQLIFPIKFKFPGWLPLSMLALIGFQLVALAIVAYIYAPNNVDSMTYHLARVVHWEQNQSVAHYATNLDRQVQLNPFAEFVILHLQILTGGDHFANLVQWFSMLLSLIGVSEIARQLGGDRTVQLVAALVCVSIPMGILQATSTQNDYVTAAWLVCFVSCGLALLKEPNRPIWGVATGLALGLALLTKSSVYFFAGPFCALFGLLLLYKLGWQALKIGLVIGGLALALNAGYFTRNLEMYGSPSGPTGDYANQLFTPQALASNLIRNAAVQLPVGEKGDLIYPLSQFGLDNLRRLHRLTGLRVNDYRTSFDPTDAFAQQPNYSENRSGNPLHFGLIVLTIGLCLIGRASRTVRLYALSLTLGFVIFSGYLLWWGGGSSRLQLPLLVLWSAPVALVLFPAGSAKLLLLVPILVGLYSLNWTFKNDIRPLTGRAEFARVARAAQYPTFPLRVSDYEEMADLIAASGCQRVGLSISENTAEYPLWMLLRERNFRGVIEHINVLNPSRVYQRPDFRPCAVVAETERPTMRPHPCQPPEFQPCYEIARGGLEEYESSFVSYKLRGGFYLYFDPKLALP